MGWIAMMYVTLTDPTKLPYMNQWKQDLNTFELSDWQDIAYALYKVSSNTTLIEANYKKNTPTLPFGPDHSNEDAHICIPHLL